MTWQYDVMVALIVIFVLFTPRSWFHDQPRPTARVQLLSQNSGARVSTYRLDAAVLPSAPSAASVTPQMQQRAHDVLSNSVNDLKGGSFQIVRMDPKLASDGAVAYYEVTVQR